MSSFRFLIKKQQNKTNKKTKTKKLPSFLFDIKNLYVPEEDLDTPNSVFEREQGIRNF